MHGRLRLLASGLLASVTTLSCAPSQVVSVPPAQPATERAPTKTGLVCTYTYGGESRRLPVPPTHEPYTVRPKNVQDRFDFKVVYVDAPADVAGVRVYTYHLASEAPVLIHEAKFPAASANHDRYGFTGKQLLYDPRGREFEYFCEWMTK